MLLLLICLLVILSAAVVGLIFHISAALDKIYVMFCFLFPPDPGPGLRCVVLSKQKKRGRSQRECTELCLASRSGHICLKGTEKRRQEKPKSVFFFAWIDEILSLPSEPSLFHIV